MPSIRACRGLGQRMDGVRRRRNVRRRGILHLRKSHAIGKSGIMSGYMIGIPVECDVRGGSKFDKAAIQPPPVNP